MGILYGVCYADVMPWPDEPPKPYVPKTPDVEPQIREDLTPMIVIGVVVLTIVIISLWVLIKNKEDKVKEVSNEKEEDNN